jgi:hypothetical protein
VGEDHSMDDGPIAISIRTPMPGILPNCVADGYVLQGRVALEGPAARLQNDEQVQEIYLGVSTRVAPVVSTISSVASARPRESGDPA